jgi:hypothetical protein
MAERGKSQQLVSYDFSSGAGGYSAVSFVWTHRGISIRNYLVYSVKMILVMNA